jgi:hypothetical protein
MLPKFTFRPVKLVHEGNGKQGSVFASQPCPIAVSMCALTEKLMQEEYGFNFWIPLYLHLFSIVSSFAGGCMHLSQFFFLSNIFLLIVLFLKKVFLVRSEAEICRPASNSKCSNAARHPGGTAMRIERSRSQS